jgi:hypothetical protein
MKFEPFDGFCASEPAKPQLPACFAYLISVMLKRIKNMPVKTFLAACVVALAVPALAYGAVREVGAPDVTPPACADKATCVVLTRVTAFQLRVGNRANVSRIPRDGSVVAYTLNLPSVKKDFYTGFSDTYYGAPTARLAILRRKPRKGVTKYRYELIAQSDKIALKPYLGTSPSFALPKPIAVKKGDMIGLTTDSWMPGFVARAEDANATWRASRPAGKCSKKGANDFTNFITARMHEKIGQIKQYNCGYTGARVLYHATVVDTPVKAS